MYVLAGNIYNVPKSTRRGWRDTKALPPQCVRCQQEGSGLWIATINDALVGPFRVEEGVKMTAPTYIASLKKHFLPWNRKKSLVFCKKMVF